LRDDSELKRYFVSILSKGVKNNTYKFALARFLLEYSLKCEPDSIKKKIANNEKEVVSYQEIANAFLKYYWHQECKYRIKQNYNDAKPPSVITAIRNVFGEDYIPDSFEKMPQEKIEAAQEKIRRKVFGKESNKTSQVIPRFQNIREGNTTQRKQIFYDYDDKKAQLEIKPEALEFFQHNHTFLMKSVILEWSKFLEKINTLPRLIAKVESAEVRRSSLRKYVKIFNDFSDCFYCNRSLDEAEIHVDHFIPWSYIFEDEAWNLVLACGRCNLRKSDSLAKPDFRDELIKRNFDHQKEIGILRKSLLKLDAGKGWKPEIEHHYRNCMEYGFNVVNLP